ncbi:MAG TPA: pseudouridine synthase [Chitinophagaceae bacterium]|nr:MAG: pseudouridine synthase [Bacteroidetes bacterium OLB11]HMN32231.1 pseudouridine synthase [Chitinophagaceae bacterium]
MKKKHHFSPSDFVPLKKDEKKTMPPNKETKKHKTPKKHTGHTKHQKPTSEKSETSEKNNPFSKNNLKLGKPKKQAKPAIEKEDDAKMPLNKYIAHCGICSRRDAIELIKNKKIKVNQIVEVNPAVRVNENDHILYDNKRIFPQKELLYFLLNKPKNCICTTSDPENRITVLDLFKEYESYRLFPVGRLDRNTTGLIIITNDGELAQKLSHPKFNIKKVYQVTLDKNLEKIDFEKIIKGLNLEDGLAEVDEIAYINPKDKREIGLQIHSGKNRIVRRIFEHLGYQVKALDRVMYAGLTKKNIQRGTFRPLEKKELIFLKHFK